ncbi:MAG: DUF2288 domain-containing protein [Bdellovibrionota bacterium]
MSDVREQLKSEILTAYWHDLKDHLERQALFVVAQELDLVDAGVEIVADNTEKVTNWIADGQIARPTLAQMKTWDDEPTRSFRSLIVAPYVLMQELGH